MRTISKEWLAFLREQFPLGSQVICWELDDPEHISTGTLEQIDEEGRFHTRMGDGAIRKLALGEEQFSVQPPEPTLLKLYMPLTADFYGRDEWGDIDETGEEWDGRTLLDYEDQIQGALVRNRMPEEKERGVMRWYDKQDSLNIKVAEKVQDTGALQPDAQKGIEDGDHQGKQDARLRDGQDREEKPHPDDGHIPQFPQPQGGFGLQIVWIDKHR